MPEWQLTTAATVERARAVFEVHRDRLREHGVPGELELTGGSSVAGLLTKGDIDLHLRVPSSDFAVAVAELRLLYAAVLPDIWTGTFAVFEEDAMPPVGIAVTAIASEHDRRFTRSWERMRSDAAARERYNALKRAGGDVEEAKSRFFDELTEE